jgi:hypothetical protein
LSWSLTSRSFARIRFEIVMRRSQNRPDLVFPHRCVKPRKSKEKCFGADNQIDELVRRKAAGAGEGKPVQRSLQGPVISDGRPSD